MNVSKSIKLSKFIKFEIKAGKQVKARAFLYIIKNALHSRPYGLLEDLYVEERYRGEGLGKALLLKVIQEAKTRKLYKLIGTSRKERKVVHQMYLKYGFKNYGYEFRLDL